MKLIRFNEVKENTNKYIFKTPKDNTYQSIKEIMYILSDFGCYIEYDYQDFNILVIEIDPTPVFEFDKEFSDIESLTKLIGYLKEDKSLYVFSKKIYEVLRNLEEMEETDDIIWRCGNVEIGDVFIIEVTLPSDNNAVINDCSDVIAFDDDRFYNLLSNFIDQYKKFGTRRHLELDYNSYEQMYDKSGVKFELVTHLDDVNQFDILKKDIIDFINSIFLEYLDVNISLENTKYDEYDNLHECVFKLNLKLKKGSLI